MRRGYRLAFLSAAVFFASFGIFSLAIAEHDRACTAEKRVPKPIAFEKDFSGQIEGYRSADLIGYSCQKDVTVTDYGNSTEFDCWRNGTVKVGAECGCKIDVISYPKQKVWMC